MCLHCLFLPLYLSLCLHPADSVLILVFCGVSALTLVLIMGLAMKFKLKRDNRKSSVQAVCAIRQHRKPSRE